MVIEMIDMDSGIMLSVAGKKISFPNNVHLFSLIIYIALLVLVKHKYLFVYIYGTPRVGSLKFS